MGSTKRGRFWITEGRGSRFLMAYKVSGSSA
jgi:hypothetical protein